MKKKRNRCHPFAFTLILMYRTLAATSLLAIAACTSAAAQNTTTTSEGFRWLDPPKDAALFDQIKGAFVDELKRDDPKVKLVEPQLYKFHKRISRIGVFQSSAFVLIAERDELASTYGHGDYFQPFNYDINTDKKEPFKRGFRDLRFHKFAHFSSAKTPDIVFTYLPALEWDTEYSLSSFRFDQQRGLWDMRVWSDNRDDDMITIGSDTVEGSEEGEYETHCLFKVADFNGDGLDDVAVRCQAVGVEDKIIDRTLLYSIQQDKPVVAILTEPQRIAALTAKLCDGTKKLKMCASKKPNPALKPLALKSRPAVFVPNNRGEGVLFGKRGHHFSGTRRVFIYENYLVAAHSAESSRTASSRKHAILLGLYEFLLRAVFHKRCWCSQAVMLLLSGSNL